MSQKRPKIAKKGRHDGVVTLVGLAGDSTIVVVGLSGDSTLSSMVVVGLMSLVTRFCGLTIMIIIQNTPAWGPNELINFFKLL